MGALSPPRGTSPARRRAAPVARRRSGRLDPVTVSILWSRLLAVVDEAAATLIRTSFSTIVREVHDMTQLLTDDRGRTLAQSAVSTPGFVGTTAGGVRHFLALWGADAWRPGDVAITNDPWVVTVLALEPGDVLTIESPGGGGYGDPAKRPGDLVRRDLEEGYVTRWPGWPASEE